jgi:hypothetical protein
MGEAKNLTKALIYCLKQQFSSSTAEFRFKHYVQMMGKAD